MFIRFLFVVFLCLASSAEALVIDGQKTIKVQHADKTSRGLIHNPEKISQDLILSYQDNYSSQYVVPPSLYDSINIDEEGRKLKKTKHDMGITVTDSSDINSGKSLDLLSLAYQAFNDGKVDMALNYYEKVLKGRPNNIDALFGAATCEQIKGDNKSAASLYLKILSIEPRNPDATNNLMVILADTDLDLAIKTLKDIDRSGSADPILFAQLGSLIARTGQYSKALRCLKIAANKVPNDPLIMYNIAAVYDAMGNKKMALYFYRMVVENMASSDKNVISVAHLNNKIKELSGE